MMATVPIGVPSLLPEFFAKPLGKMARMNSSFVLEFIRNEGLTENTLGISGGTPDVFG